MSHEIETVSVDDEGQRLDRWLKKQRPDLPYVLVQKLLRKGQVRVDGKRAKPDTRLSAGAQVRMPLKDDSANGGSGSASPGGHPARARRYDITSLRDNVIYEDDDLLILNKPSGLAVQGGSGLSMHLEMLMDEFALHGVNPRLVHRLDRETSGVLVMARRAAIARRMMELFMGRDIEKTYWALVSPMPYKDSGLIDKPLEKVQIGGDLDKVRVSAQGRPAQTEWRVLARNPDRLVALVAFTPLTGRTHQIRVHAASEGFPLLGDKKYGGNMDLLTGARLRARVQLHAARLRFAHPRSGEMLDIQAPLPDDLVESWTEFSFPVT